LTGLTPVPSAGATGMQDWHDRFFCLPESGHTRSQFAHQATCTFAGRLTRLCTPGLGCEIMERKFPSVISCE